MNTVAPIWLAGLVLLGLQKAPAAPAAGAAEALGLPNILWIVAEDINPHLGCYGDPDADTPNLDRFAATGLRYRHCWSTAPVCAPARTALISGLYPPSAGAEHMRSQAVLPGFLRLYPEWLRARGYYCVNNNKEDYNLLKPGLWDQSSNKAHYRNRKPGQPFFAAFNIAVCHESQIRVRPHVLKHDPARVRLPAYHPDTPETRQDWAQYHDQISAMDAIAGRHLRDLDEAGLAEDTLVFFYGDNGSGMPRSKRWPYNSGLHVPLIVRVPAKYRHLAPPDYQAGGTSARLVSFVDFAPTLLSLAGVQAPDWMQGAAFLGAFQQPAPHYLHGLRGRMDERGDLVRSVRNERFIYIRNYMPHRIYGQHISYMFQTPTTRVWKQLYDEGKLKPPQTRFWETKPPEEFYDLVSDPDEVNNLAGSPAHQAIIEELRRAQQAHALRIRDLGFLPEGERGRRAGDLTLWEMGHNPARYPIERILAAADLASSLRPEALDSLRRGLRDDDSAVRYWSALGFLMRGSNAVAASRQDLRSLFKDSSPSVRVAAAEALGRFGSGDDLAASLAALKELLGPDKHGAAVTLEALGAVDALGPKAAPLLETLKIMPTRDPQAPGRMAEYVPRITADLLKSLEPKTPASSQTGR